MSSSSCAPGTAAAGLGARRDRGRPSRARLSSPSARSYSSRRSSGRRSRQPRWPVTRRSGAHRAGGGRTWLGPRSPSMSCSKLRLHPSDRTPRRFRFPHPIVRRAVYDGSRLAGRIGAHGRAAAALRPAWYSPPGPGAPRRGAAASATKEAIQLLVQAGRDAAPRAPETGAVAARGRPDCWHRGEADERRLVAA